MSKRIVEQEPNASKSKNMISSARYNNVSSKSQLGMIGKSPAMQITAKNKFKNSRNPAMTMSLNDDKLPFARLISKAEQSIDQKRGAILESNLEGPQNKETLDLRLE